MMLRLGPGPESGLCGATAVTTSGFLGITEAVGGLANDSAMSGFVSGAAGAAFAG